MELLPKWAGTALVIAGCLAILAGLVNLAIDRTVDWMPVAIGLMLLGAGGLLKRSRQNISN